MKIDRKAWLEKHLAAIPDRVKKELKSSLQLSAEEMVDVAKRFAPSRSGALRNSISYTFGQYKAENANVRSTFGGRSGDHDLAVTVHAGDAVAWYAGLVEYGTTAHTIEPAPGKALNINGTLVYNAVQHPGADAQPYFGPAWRLTKNRARSRLSRAMNKAIKAK